MKKSWKTLLFCAMVAAGIGVRAGERPPESVLVGTVSQLNKETTRRYIGKVTAVDEVSLVARISGVILKQHFASGAFVKAGDLLFEIEDTSYRAAVDSAKARLAQCEAELKRCDAELIRLKAEEKFAKADFERQRTLMEKNAISQTVYEEAERKKDVAEAALRAMEAAKMAALAELDAAKAALTDAENNLSYTKIYAPISGKTGRATYSPGNYVTPSSGALVTIVSTDTMYVNIWITMSDYNRIFGGSFDILQNQASMQIKLADNSIFVDSSSAPDDCRIVFIDNKVDKDTDSIRIRALVNNSGMRLIPDSLVAVTIFKKDGVRTVVPVSAIVSNGTINFVYVLDAENKASVRPVVLGESQGKLQIIESGLQPGERIVVDGTHKVIPGHVVIPNGGN